MAKKIRAARHYQKPDDRARALAEHAIPHVRSVVRTALGHIAMHAEAHIREMVRIGKPADQIAAAALPRTMWQDALAETFSALTDVWRLGGMLGAEHITGAFRKAGRFVDFRKYNPDQERDGSGRWTSGGGGGAGASITGPIPPPTAPWRERLTYLIGRTAKGLGYDPKNIIISSETREFEVAGKKYVSAGQADFKTGKITIYENHADDNSTPGLVAHEIEHMKFEKFFDDANAERMDMLQKTQGWPRGSARNPDSTLTATAALRWPTYAKMMLVGNKPFEELRMKDGVSDYSKQYWIGWKAGEVSNRLAIHETLAEMSRLHIESGRIRGAHVWQRLYRATNEHWNKTQSA